jgi:hypothetical protein
MRSDKQELDVLRAHRVRLRAGIQRAQLPGVINDFIERRRVIENLQICLNGTEERWRELNARLGRDPNPPAVRLGR